MFKNLKERALDMYQKVKQTAEQAEVTINKFVSDNRHSDNQEIVLCYAKGLTNSKGK